MSKLKNYIVELKVNNHAGVMSHITGLFSRRNFNLEGILCVPLKKSTKSHIYLIVKQEENIEQIIKQLQKLYDVIKVRLLTGSADILMRKMARLFNLGNILKLQR
ncbi:MAG: acetolactate synthase small subunit [Candidatus Omnitrophica bacterium]|jgi:acetolactate synthase-1/3 small subunit|nr:acetolactate synthase small subunit [Candidatus Omnitrophota bacterium]